MTVSVDDDELFVDVGGVSTELNRFRLRFDVAVVDCMVPVASIVDDFE